MSLGILELPDFQNNRIIFGDFLKLEGKILVREPYDAIRYIEFKGELESLLEKMKEFGNGTKFVSNGPLTGKYYDGEIIWFISPEQGRSLGLEPYLTRHIGTTRFSKDLYVVSVEPINS